MTLRPPSTSIDHDNAVIGVGGFSASVAKLVNAETGLRISIDTVSVAGIPRNYRPRDLAGSNPAARISTAFMSAKCHGRSGGMKALYKTLLIVHAPFKYGVWV